MAKRFEDESPGRGQAPPLGWCRVRLKQRDKGRGEMRAMPLHLDGRLWSRYLESFLVPDGEFLRLYDTAGQLRLTKAESEARRADEEAEARQTEVRRADAEARRAEALAERLRSLGIDPDQP